MLKNIEILVKYKKELKIDSELYLFIKPNSRFPIRGNSCMSKFLRECGAKIPGLLRSTKLRKHLGTMCQVLWLSSEHLGLLASFYGPYITHKQFYHLPEETLQTAKLPKVHHLINTGGIAKYKGKTFDGIEFSQEDPVPEDSDEDDKEGESDADSELGNELANQKLLMKLNQMLKVNPFRKKNKGAVGVKRKLTYRKPWSSVEEAAVLKHLGCSIKSGKLPGKRECEAAKAAEPQVLKERSWTLMKNFIRIRITSRARKMKAAS